MSKGVFIIGTDTDVGKTIVCAGLMHVLRSNAYNACYFKPALSGAIEKNGNLLPGDTQFVKKVSCLDEKDESITPYIFKTPVSPHLASKLENNNIDISKIKCRFEYLKEKYEYILAEGMGGLIIPLTNDGYMLYHLIQELDINCLVVARAGVGTINHTSLTVKFAQSVGIKVKGIIINGYTNAFYEDDNIKTIEKVTEVPVISVIPKLEGVNSENLEIGNIKQIFDERINFKLLLDMMDEI